MKILAIDTSSSACSVALMRDDSISALHKMAPMQQTKLILPMIKHILEDTNVELNQLDALAFGCGPGSFTGIRIATSVMQGLAYATQLPLISISSLAAAAQAAYQQLGWKYLLVAMDAKIQEVYWGTYAINSSGIAHLVGAEQVGTPQEVTLPNSEAWYGVGSAFQSYAELSNLMLVGNENTILPTAKAMLTLAKDKYLKNEWLSPENALPTYLRNTVAKKKAK